MRCLAPLLLLLAAAAAAQAPPVLIVDTNPAGGDGIVSGGTGDTRNDDADHPLRPYLVEYRGELYFGASDASGDREVWRTNGTPEGTVRLDDLNGAGPASPTLFVRYQGNLYFAADAGSGHSTFVTDGFTPALYRPDTAPLRVLESTAPTPALLMREDPAEVPIVLGQCRADGSGGPLCANGPLSSQQNDIVLAETDGLIVFKEASSGHLFRTFGTQASQDSLSARQLGEDFTLPGAPYATGSRVFFSCFWQANGDVRGTELCVSTGAPDQTGLATDLRVGPASSEPRMFGVFGDWLYFGARTDDSPTRDVLFRIRGEGVADVELERLDATAGTAPDLGVFLPRFFELGGEVYYAGFTSASGARIWRGAGVELAGLPADIRNVATDGETAYLLASDGGPFQIYAFDGTTATVVADMANGLSVLNFGTVYNGGLLYVASELYAYGVQPRAIRRPVEDAPAGGVVFETYDGAALVPATFRPTAGVAPGELRVSRLDARREPLPDAAPALATLPGYYHLGAGPGLAALRGDLTLSYTDADLDGEGVTDEAGLGVWQWSAEDQAWVERAVATRDSDANTLTVADVRPADFFVLGTNTPVRTEGATPLAALRLDAPVPNPAASAARVAFRLGAAGPARLSVVDVLGREVARVVDGVQAAGAHEVPLDLRTLAPGVYVVRLLSVEGVASASLTVAR